MVNVSIVWEEMGGARYGHASYLFVGKILCESAVNAPWGSVLRLSDRAPERGIEEVGEGQTPASFDPHPGGIDGGMISSYLRFTKWNCGFRTYVDTP